MNSPNDKSEPTPLLQFDLFGLRIDIRCQDEAARRLIIANYSAFTAHSAPVDWRALLLRLTGIDPSLCPLCGGALVSGPPRAQAFAPNSKLRA